MSYLFSKMLNVSIRFHETSMNIRVDLALQWRWWRKTTNSWISHISKYHNGQKTVNTARKRNFIKLTTFRFIIVERSCREVICTRRNLSSECTSATFLSYLANVNLICHDKITCFYTLLYYKLAQLRKIDCPTLQCLNNNICQRYKSSNYKIKKTTNNPVDSCQPDSYQQGSPISLDWQ